MRRGKTGFGSAFLPSAGGCSAKYSRVPSPKDNPGTVAWPRQLRHHRALNVPEQRLNSVTTSPIVRRWNSNCLFENGTDVVAATDSSISARPVMNPMTESVYRRTGLDHGACPLAQIAAPRMVLK